MDVLTSAKYSDIISTIAMIVATIAVPASGYLSYHYAVKGEKRKEWNALAEPVIDYFFKKSREHSKGHFYLGMDIPFDKIIPLRRRFSKKESTVFERAFVPYVELSNKFNNPKVMKQEDKEIGCIEAARLASAITSAIKLK